MRHGIAERLHLLVNRSELGSPFFNLGFDFRVNREQFGLTFADQEHFAGTLSDGDRQECDFKSNPPHAWAERAQDRRNTRKIRPGCSRALRRRHAQGLRGESPDSY